MEHISQVGTFYKERYKKDLVTSENYLDLIL